MNRYQDYLRVAAIAALLAMPATLAYADDASPPQASTASGYIRDFLSDPRRTGSLAGSILGGALLTNPAGPIVGSVIGFFVGKNSMYDEDKARAQQANVLYARRDIAPQGGMSTLSLSNGKGIDFDAPASATPGAPTQGAPEISGFLREQLVEKCSGGSGEDPRLRSLCFYLQGS